MARTPSPLPSSRSSRDWLTSSGRRSASRPCPSWALGMLTDRPASPPWVLPRACQVAGSSTWTAGSLPATSGPASSHSPSLRCATAACHLEA
eukprot:jgi/Mesen1/8831/ME000053S08237